MTSFVDTFGASLSRRTISHAFLAQLTAETFRKRNRRRSLRLPPRLRGAASSVGYVKLGPPELPVETPPRTVELCQLYVLKDMARRRRRRGADGLGDRGGRASAAPNDIQLSVYVDNHRARRFYERYGFDPVGRYDFMVGSHADEDIDHAEAGRP